MSLPMTRIGVLIDAKLLNGVGRLRKVHVADPLKDDRPTIGPVRRESLVGDDNGRLEFLGLDLLDPLDDLGREPESQESGPGGSFSAC